MMNIRNEENQVFNIKVSKLIGLYQMLDPGTIKYQGRNVSQIIMAIVLLIVTALLVMFVMGALNYWTTNLPLTIDYIWKFVNMVLLIYKMWLIIHRSDDIWDDLSITRYDFTSNDNRNKHNILDHGRDRVVLYTTLYFIMYMMCVLFFVIITLTFNEDKLPVTNHDGSIGYYRQNVFNLYVIVSDETYNAHYCMFFIIEGTIALLVSLLFVIFDFLVFTLCFGVCCQMEVIFYAFESLGFKLPCDHNSSVDNIDENKTTSIDYEKVFDELKIIIIDHQAVMEKYTNFLNLFRRLMLVQFFISSTTVIIVCFIFTMSFTNDERFKDADLILKKICCIFPPVFIQFFLECYLFEYLHNQKDSIIFAMYSSNWTEMDMKCKQLLLLTMEMNNANQNKLRITSTKTINLNMFFRTMGNCYTFITFLVNYTQKNVE